MELASFQCTQAIIDAANKYAAGISISLSHPPSEQCVSRWPILSAWRWLVRIPTKEAALCVLPSPDPDAPEPETAMDLAYRCVLPSPIGYAIHKMEVPRVSEPTVEDVATLLDVRRLSKEDEDRVAMWQRQRPVIMVVTVLAVGFRRLRAEVRRRVDAWKILASSGGAIAQPLISSPTVREVQLIRDVSPIPGRRNSFHSAFTRWAISSGEPFIRTLRLAPRSKLRRH